ncbi:exonuclease domain-containing protein [Glycomyces sp. NRRL B-16210]|uniref:exonuclease domain-containing protein n=1 Tax=Glycomyces sp. NRRL B-16210 TaxID=1463821 RepID=UPI0004BFECA4|nr:exonuclease domain-containing protein [Glycomyces sp. NRRL B-16210]
MSEQWFAGPLLGFDTETTGVDVAGDRIVQAALIAEAGPSTWLIDPGVPIPPGATRVHGITDEKVKAEGAAPEAALREVADALRAAIEAEVPIVAFRAGFDCTLLSYELERHGLPQLAWDRAAIIDPSVLDKRVDRYRRGKRTLGVTAAHYGVAHAQAHSAVGDAEATVALARAIGAMYPEVGGLTPRDLHDSQVRWHAEDAASLEEYFRRKGREETVDRRWPLCR